MPSVPVRLAVETKEAVDTIRKVKRGTFSWHVIQAIKEWDALPEEEKNFEKSTETELKQYQISYQSQEIEMMERYKRSPIPIAAIARTALKPYIQRLLPEALEALKKMEKDQEAAN